MFPEFSMSTQYREKYPGVGFGLTLISGCRNHENPPGFDQYKRKLLRKMRKRETLAEISARIDTYADFFQSFGFVCPLSKHLKRTINSGFPRYDLIVDAHFMAEMCAGILVAVTDYDRFDGNLTLDTAKCVPAWAVVSLLPEKMRLCCGMKKKLCVSCARGRTKKPGHVRIRTGFFFTPMRFPALKANT
jgi:hypothetical protein